MNTITARHNLTVLINALMKRNTRVISVDKARGVARAMGAVASVKAVRVGGFWTLRMDVDGAMLRLTVPVDALQAERDGAIIALDGAPAVEIVAPTAPIAPERAAKLDALRAEIARIEAAPIGALKVATAPQTARAALPAGESALSWEVKLAGLAASRPAPGSRAWRMLRAS